MKFNLLLIAIISVFILGCSSENISIETTEVNKDIDYEEYEEYNEVDLEIKAARYNYRVPTSFPFEDDLSKVMLVSYDFARIGVESESDEPINYDIIGKNSKIGFNYFSEKVFLNSLQIDSLKRIIFNYTTYNDYYGSDCYWPRHCFYFLNDKDEVLGYLEVCLECDNSLARPKEMNLNSSEQLRAIEKLILHCGIKNNVGENNVRDKLPSID